MFDPDSVQYMPLSPKLAWFATWEEKTLERVTISKQEVESLNELCAFHSEQWLYASTYRETLERLAVQAFGTGLKLVPSGFGFTGKPLDIGQFKPKADGIAPVKKNKPRGRTGT